MSNGFIQVPPDSTGKKLQTFENTVGPNVVEAEAVVLVDSTGSNACNVNGSGQLPVSIGNTPSVNQGTSPWLTRPTDGTNPISQTYNVNTAGSEFVEGITLRKVTAGVSTELGSSGSPMRVDPTGTTIQPISGTVTANAGTGTMAISAASLPLPSGAATAAKQPALGTAGTASADVITVQGIASMTPVKVDGSGVTQPVSGTVAVSNFPATQPISGSVSVSNFPATQPVSGTVSSTQGTSPWVVTGSKTNNNAAPSTDNIGVLSALANAATPSFTEGDLVTKSVDLGGALRTITRQTQSLGYYSIGTSTGIYAGIAAGGALFSMRWTDATRLCMILKVSVSVVMTTVATADGQVDRQLIVARSFSASDTGGTAIVLTGNNQKHRTSFGTSLVGDMRIAANAALTAGTRTLDGVGLGIAAASTGTGAVTSSVNTTLIPKTDLFSAYAGPLIYPLILAQNEGIIIRMVTAEPSGASLVTYVDVAWAEVNSY